MCAPEKRIIVIFSFYVNFGSSASFDILCFSVPCRVLFRCVLSFSYPFPWHISRVFFPLHLPVHIRRRFLRSLFKKSEETRAQFPHLPLWAPSVRPSFFAPCFCGIFGILIAFHVRFVFFLSSYSQRRGLGSPHPPSRRTSSLSCRREVSPHQM